MLKKLKLKFILHNILMHGVAVIAIFFAFCLLIYIAEEEKLTEVLEDNTQIVQSQLPSFPSTPKKPDGLIYNHSFTVLVNHDDEIAKKVVEIATDKALRERLSQDTLAKAKVLNDTRAYTERLLRAYGE